MPEDSRPPTPSDARTRLPVRRRWIVLGALATALVAIALLWDWNWFKGPVERRVSAATGRAFAIGGDLDVDFGWPLRVQMGQLRFANPDWAAREQMLTVEQVDFSIRLLRALRGQIVIPDVALTRPEIDLEQRAPGDNNWTFGSDRAERPGAEPGNVPVIGRVQIDRGLVHYADAVAKDRLDVEVDTDVVGGTPALRVQARGTLRGQPFEASGTGGGVLALADASTPYPLDARFAIGPTHGKVKGSVTGLVALSAADLQLEIAGASLAELFPLIHVTLPPTPPYHVAGHLLRSDATWRFQGFSGGVGDSDLSGDASFTYRDERPFVKAVLKSKLLDLDDLGGIIGAPPQTGAGETASAQQRREAQAKRAQPTVLPDKPFHLERLRAMDADVAFEGKSIRGRTPIDDLAVHVLLDRGQLRATPLNFGVAGGNIVSTIGVDARGDTLQGNADVEVRRVDLHKLFPGRDMGKESFGLVGGRAQLKLRGNSFAEMLGHADGTLGLASANGTVSNLLLELVGLDAAEVLRRLFRGDKPVKLRCAVADFAVTDGVMAARSMVIDTSDTNVNVKGTINLRDESLDLTLHPLPKDYSPLALRSPLHVNGSFKNPKVRPDSELVIKGGIAAILGALAGPLAALIPLIETGPGDDVDCERLMEAVHRHADARPAG